MATFISRVLPSSVANIPEIESARKFKKVDDNKHTFLSFSLILSHRHIIFTLSVGALAGLQNS